MNLVFSPKKILSFFALLVSTTCCYAQNSVTLVFSGEDQHGSHVRMNGLTIQNLSRNWQETLLFPDTIYTMVIGTGVEDIQQANEMKVMPNPFEGHTRVNVFSSKDEEAKMLIVDINGRKHAQYTGRITSGDNYFDISLITPQTYILSIQTKSGTRCLKMVNAGHGGTDRISYAGNNPQTVKVNIKGSSSHVFELGDEMRYTGFAQIYDHLRQSVPIQQMQYTSEEINLVFEGYPIEVSTDSVLFDDETTFICYGTVNTYGLGAVQTGFCWGCAPNPSLSDSHISSGMAEGLFAGVLTGMDTSSTYYIRAYAINGTDTAYGENISCAPIVSSFIQTGAFFIPDGVDCGNGCAHESFIEVSGYTPSATIQSVEDILYTRIKLEHSFIGDLYIALTCPNGQSVKIMNKYGTYGTGGSSNCASQIPTPWGWNWTADTAVNSAFFGDAYDRSSGCDPADSLNQMGTPWNYCWSNSTTNGYQYANGQGYVYGSSNITDGKVDSTNTINMTQVYHPDQPFSQLVGCPINGIWSIKILDGWGGDNGWVSEWEVAFRGRNRPAAAEPDATLIHPCQNVTTVTDYDGNVYHTVAIGNQCWLRENMRTTHYTNGEMIHLGDETSVSMACYYLPENIEDTLAGFLYNWTAVMDSAIFAATSTNHVQGICPYGWHVPVDAEWSQLTEYITLRSEYTCGDNTSNMAKSMATKTGWNISENICAVGHDMSSNNATYFSAFPAGRASGISDDYGNSANFWTATAYNSDFAYYHSLNYANSFVERNCYGDKSNGMSVRCVRNEGTPVFLPSVSTLSVSGITEYSALCGGQISSTGGATITERGVCWSTSPDPTVSDNHITDSSGLNTFTCSLDSLAYSTTYYIRAYAINAAGIAYGEQRFFTTLAPYIAVSTSSVSNITCVSATCGGDVTAGNPFAVSARGVCWSTSAYPTLADSHTVDSSGIGSFTSSITGLQPNTTYRVRAYAIYYNADTVYGGQRTFVTLTDLPMVTTATLSDISYTTATCGGEVTYEGIAAVTARGVCWSTSQNPTINDSLTVDSSGLGSFISFITGLQPNTHYYVRAYATNSVGTVYGTQRSFSTPVGTPVVSTNIISSITDSSAVCGGNVTNEAAYAVTARGICWSTSQNPTINDNFTVDSSGLGSFTSLITGLQPNTRYYVRAYATNNSGTAYGVRRSLITTAKNPSVTTSAVSNITCIAADCGGTVSSDGISGVTAKGVCWSTSTNPTITDSLTIDGNDVGSFTSHITGLQPGTHYYVRAYATNNAGTVYGTQRQFTTPVATPTITTNGVNRISSTSVTCDGNVSYEGIAAVTARGVCWSTSPNPTLNDNHTVDSSGVGSFTSLITGLQPFVHYYVRAYATNSAGTAYGNEIEFSTSDGFPCLNADTLTDIDGNIYNTVQLGTQCWMRENLRTTRYANGTDILLSSNYYGGVCRYYPDNNESNVPIYGYLYSWHAVMGGSSSSDANPSGVQGICPNGWHVPSDSEWTQLTDYVSSQNQYVCGTDSSYIGKALAADFVNWSNNTTTCAVGNIPSDNNSTNFSAVPAGHRYDSGFVGFLTYTDFWSSTQDNYYRAYVRTIVWYEATVNRQKHEKSDGLSVRCLRN